MSICDYTLLYFTSALSIMFLTVSRTASQLMFRPAGSLKTGHFWLRFLMAAPRGTLAACDAAAGGGGGVRKFVVPLAKGHLENDPGCERFRWYAGVLVGTLLPGEEATRLWAWLWWRDMVQPASRVRASCDRR